MLCAYLSTFEKALAYIKHFNQFGGENMSEYQRLLACPNDEANIAYEDFISHLDDELFE